MAILIKSPNPDEIWEKWKLQNVKKSKLEKHYAVKGARFELGNITAAEYVKNVEKAALIYFEKKYSVQAAAAKKGKTFKGTTKDIEKEKFYVFKGQPDKNDWKAGAYVPTLNSLKGSSCDKCKGKGGLTCKSCGGSKLTQCPDCKAKGVHQCKYCNGTGKIEIELTVVDERQSKDHKREKVNCDRCFGTGKVVCATCGGSGKTPCKECQAMGLVRCDECRGHGMLYVYNEEAVPFRSVSNSEPIILASTSIKGFEKEMGKEIHQALQEVEGIVVKNPEKELEPKNIEANLGYMDKQIQKILKETSKDLKKTGKKEDLNILLPMYLFPLIVLSCETKKGKKFQVFCIGSDKKFKVFGEI